MDWGKFVFGGRGEEYESLRRAAEQRFWFDPTLAEEAFSQALEAIDRDNWVRLGRFDGRSSPRTFLMSAFQNALEDFSRRIYGRVRPPKWVVELGGPWIDAHEWLCMQRIDAREVAARLVATGRVGDEVEATAMVRAIRAGLPSCGAGVGPLRLRPESDDAFDPTVLGQAEELPGARPCDFADGTEAALLAISTLLGLVDSPLNRLEIQSITALALSDEDVVTLRLVYVENESVSACARMLGEPEHTVRRRLRRLHERLAEAMRAEGVEGAEPEASGW